MSHIEVGDKIPSVVLYEGSPDNERNISELISRKKAIIFGIPGAYVPGCSRVHLRGFIEKSEELRSKGFEEIVCVSVNDPFVLAAWGQSKGADNKVRMLADPAGNFTDAIHMGVDIPELGGTRSLRYSMVIVNGVVKELYIDPQDARLACLPATPTFCR